MASNLRYRDYASPVHPMADFLTRQLPMMLQQHKQNRDNRILKKFKIIEADLDTIRALIKDIDDSKINKLW